MQMRRVPSEGLAGPSGGPAAHALIPPQKPKMHKASPSCCEETHWQAQMERDVPWWPGSGRGRRGRPGRTEDAHVGASDRLILRGCRAVPSEGSGVVHLMSDRILASKHGLMDGPNNCLSFKRRRRLGSPASLLLNMRRS